MLIILIYSYQGEAVIILLSFIGISNSKEDNCDTFFALKISVLPQKNRRWGS